MNRMGGAPKERLCLRCKFMLLLLLLLLAIRQPLPPTMLLARPNVLHRHPCGLQMRFAYAHFPINVTLSKSGGSSFVEIRNFLGACPGQLLDRRLTLCFPPRRVWAHLWPRIFAREP